MRFIRNHGAELLLLLVAIGGCYLVTRTGGRLAPNLTAERLASVKHGMHVTDVVKLLGEPLIVGSHFAYKVVPAGEVMVFGHHVKRIGERHMYAMRPAILGVEYISLQILYSADNRVLNVVGAQHFCWGWIVRPPIQVRLPIFGVWTHCCMHKNSSLLAKLSILVGSEVLDVVVFTSTSLSSTPLDKIEPSIATLSPILGATKKAFHILKKLLRYPVSEMGYYHLAFAQVALALKEGAIINLKQVLERRPNHRKIRG